MEPANQRVPALAGRGLRARHWLAGLTAWLLLATSARAQEPIRAEVIESTGQLNRADLLASLRDLTPLDALPPEALLFFMSEARSFPFPSQIPPNEAMPSFAQLVRQPGEHRGKRVAIVGTVLRAVTHAAPENEHGIKQFHELWVYTRDSHNNPYVVILEELPEDMPRGADISESIELTGTFLFLVRYKAIDTGRKAPLLAASKLNWKPASLSSATRHWLTLQWMVAAAAFALLTWAVVSYWSKAQRRRMSSGREISVAMVDPKLAQILIELDRDMPVADFDSARDERPPDSRAESDQDEDRPNNPFI